MTSTRALLVLVILAIPVLGSVPSVARAQAPTAEQRAHARELYGQGQAAFTAEHYQEALERYQAAFREVPNPVVLLGVSLAQERLGQREAARATLEQYLILRPDAPDRTAVQARIDALPAPTTGTVHVTATPAEAAIALDGRAIGTGTAEATATAGSHEIHVTLAGHAPITRTVDVTVGHRIDLELTLVASSDTAMPVDEGEEGGLESADDVFGDSGSEEASDAPSETAELAPTPPPADPSVGVWVTTAIAGVALVTGTVFGFLALSKQSDFDANPTAGTANDGETFALVADLSFAVAAVAGITAIVLYATERPGTPPAESTARLRIMPLAGPTGGGVALGASF